MSEKCGSARNWTWVFRLLIECLNHSATEPTMMATRLIIDLNVVRSMHRLRNNVLNSWKLRWTQGFLLIGRLIGMVDIFLCIWLQHVLDRRHWGTVGGALFSGTLRQVLCVALIPPAAVDSCCVTELLAWGQVHLGRPGLHLDWLDVPVDACWSRVRSCSLSLLLANSVPEGRVLRLHWRASIGPQGQAMEGYQKFKGSFTISHN